MRRAEIPPPNEISGSFFLFGSSFEQTMPNSLLTPHRRNAPSLESRLARILFPRNRVYRGYEAT